MAYKRKARVLLWAMDVILRIKLRSSDVVDASECCRGVRLTKWASFSTRKRPNFEDKRGSGTYSCMLDADLHGLPQATR